MLTDAPAPACKARAWLALRAGSVERSVVPPKISEAVKAALVGIASIKSVVMVRTARTVLAFAAMGHVRRRAVMA